MEKYGSGHCYYAALLCMCVCGRKRVEVVVVVVISIELLETDSIDHKMRNKLQAIENVHDLPNNAYFRISTHVGKIV